MPGPHARTRARATHPPRSPARASGAGGGGGGSRRRENARRRAAGAGAATHVTAPRTLRRPTPARQGEPRARRLAGQDPGPERAPGVPACPCLRIQSCVSVSAPSCLPPRVRALTASQVRRAGGRRGPGSREGRGHAGSPPVSCPPSPPCVRYPPGSPASCPTSRRRRRGLPGDLAVGSGVPDFPRGLQVACRRNSSARICTQRESRSAQAHGVRESGLRGGWR